MKILLTSTIALGALCLFDMTQPAQATVSNDPNIHLVHGGGGGGRGGGRAGGREFGDHGHEAGRGFEGHAGEAYRHGGYGKGYGYGRGYGYGVGAVGVGIGAGVVGEEVIENTGPNNCYDAAGNWICSN